MGLPPRPPSHTVDGDPIYVAQSDTAWKTIPDPPEDDDEVDDHPVRLYWQGETRFRLTDEVREYLRDDSQPTKWYLRRPPPEQWQEISYYMLRVYRNQGDERVLYWHKACLLAFRYGVRKVTPPPYEGCVIRGQAIGDDVVSELEQWPGLVTEVGNAVWLAFQPLRADEGKA